MLLLNIAYHENQLIIVQHKYILRSENELLIQRFSIVYAVVRMVNVITVWSIFFAMTTLMLCSIWYSMVYTLAMANCMPWSIWQNMVYILAIACLMPWSVWQNMFCILALHSLALIPHSEPLG